MARPDSAERSRKRNRKKNWNPRTIIRNPQTMD
jgi:7,8-dihydro-6-hydroxymethylpterin-pyrophosphokinase